MTPTAITPNPMYPITSRYYLTGVSSWTGPDGKPIAYLRRRFIPLPDRYSDIGTYKIRQGDRPDTVAWAQMSDPLQFWRICDPNAVLNPPELTAVAGRSIRITLAEGIPGSPNA